MPEPGPASDSAPPQEPSTAAASEEPVATEQPLAGEQSRLLDARATAYANARSQEKSGRRRGAKSPMAVRADLLSDSKTTDSGARRNVDSAGDSVESVFNYTCPPSPPDPSAPGSGGLSIDVDGRTLGTSFGSVGVNREVAVSGSLDSFGASVDVSERSIDREHGANIYLMRGYTSLDFSSSRSYHDGTSRGRSGGLFYEPGGGGASGSLAFKTIAGLTTSIGGFAGGGLIREIVDHGDYTGDQESLRGTRCVEMRRARNIYGVALPGLSLDLGVGGRIGVAKGSTVSYTTHLPREQARGLLFEDGNRLSRALRNRGRALGIVSEPLPPPNLSKIDQIKVGDRIELSTEGALSGGIVAGVPAVGYAGVQLATRGEFELTVERPSQDLLQVKVVPTKVKTVQFSGRTVVLDATAARSTAQALSRCYTFDLTRPKAVAAYQALLKGELPGGGKAKQARIPAPAPATEASQKMPAGVKKTEIEWLKGRFLRSHIDVGFTLIEWGIAHNRADFLHHVERDRAALDERVRSLDSCRTIPLSGDETRGVRASLVVVSGAGKKGKVSSHFVGLRLIAYVTDTKARGLELNDDIDAINRAFGTAIGRFHQPSLKNARAIAIESTLGADELKELARLPADQLSAAAVAAGTPPRPLLALGRALREQPDPRRRAELVQEYLADNGFAAMGALVRLLGADQMALSTTNGDLEEYLDRARTMLFKYDQPIAASDAGDVVQRFAEIEKLDANLVKLRALVADDPLLEAETRAGDLAQIDQARAALQRTLGLDHLDAGQRQALIDRLGSGWVTAREARIIELLEHRD
ncbi:MAG: hypothetical protein JXR83_08400 [Deltaproteobacteria bacterium]|nr:hypothetical protein [Deltaproteobacteria bacterium]